MALVEALVGTALLGTVLVALLVAKGRLDVQSAQARWRSEACQVADELLDQWWTQRDRIERQGAGEVPGRPGWRWTTARIENEAAAKMGAEVIALEVLAPALDVKQPVARVEFVLPAKDFAK